MGNPWITVALLAAAIGAVNGVMQRRWNSSRWYALYAAVGTAVIVPYLFRLGWPSNMPLLGVWAFLAYAIAAAVAVNFPRRNASKSGPPAP